MKFIMKNLLYLIHILKILSLQKIEELLKAKVKILVHIWLMKLEFIRLI